MDKAATEFANSGRVDEAARAAHLVSAGHVGEPKLAEELGKSHAKGEQPAQRQQSGAPQAP